MKLRGLTAFLAVIFILMLAFGVYFFVGGTLSGQVTVLSAPAGEYTEAFSAVRDIVTSGAAPQTFVTEEMLSPDGYLLMDVNILLKNKGLFDAQWLDASVTPADGDVAVYSVTGAGSDVPRLSSGQINLKIITRSGAENPRFVTIGYYVYGMRRSVRLALPEASN